VDDQAHELEVRVPAEVEGIDLVLDQIKQMRKIPMIRVPLAEGTARWILVIRRPVG
jgi:hypothetical protein